MWLSPECRPLGFSWFHCCLQSIVRMIVWMARRWGSWRACCLPCQRCSRVVMQSVLVVHDLYCQSVHRSLDRAMVQQALFHHHDANRSLQSHRHHFWVRESGLRAPVMTRDSVSSIWKMKTFWLCVVLCYALHRKITRLRMLRCHYNRKIALINYTDQ